MTSRPDWLSLTHHEQRAILLPLLRHASRSRLEAANMMLAAPPLPADQTDAKARASAVIRYLAGGYKVGNVHPSFEELR
jgi:hypothetical protein